MNARWHTRNALVGLAGIIHVLHELRPQLHFCIIATECVITTAAHRSLSRPYTLRRHNSSLCNVLTIGL